MTLALTGTAGAPVGVIARGPQTRSLTLTGTADVPRGFITLSPFLTAALYDAANNFLAPLPLANGIKYGRTVSDPAFVSFALPVDDAATDLAVPGCFVKAFWRGKCRQAAELTDSSVDLAKDGTLWRQWDNLPGALALLAKGCVWPEYGLDRTYSTSRTFGPQSATGAWWRLGNWTPAIGVQYQDDTGFRRLKPAGLAYPNPYWVSKYGPYVKRPAGSVEWIRHHFSTFGDEITIQILATADDHVTLWLDGEQIIATDAQQAQTWQTVYQYTGRLQAGLHVLAGKIRNGGKHPSPMALIVALQQTQENGDVVKGETIARTSPIWNAADENLGFRRADVIRRCVFENRDHDIPVFDLIRLDFTATNGTDGAVFADDPDEHTRDVGESLLTTVQALAEKFLDVGMDPDTLKLQAWPRKGSDKSATVILHRGDVDTGSLLDGSVGRQAPRFTVLLFQLGDMTWLEIADADLVTEWGRIVSSVSAGATRTHAQAQHVADSMFAEQALAAATFTATITSLTGPQFHVDFDEGDTIGFEDENGDVIAVRVMSGLVDGSADGAPRVELELTLDES